MSFFTKNNEPNQGEAIQTIENVSITYENPRPDVFVAKIPIANASWVTTSEGTVVIDTLIRYKQGRELNNHIRESGKPITHIIYTHGHVDHVGGAAALMEDNPEIIAHRYLPERLENYQILREHRARIASVQFNLPFRPEINPSYQGPTRIFDNSMTFQSGDKTFELYHGRGETDDAIWIHVPEINTVFVGDLIIMGFPNIGNPFKPTRFALQWARALEAVRDKKPELLVSHGGQAVYKGAEIKELLDVTIEAVHSIHDQVVEGINKDIPIDELIHQVALPDHLKNNKYLKFEYSRPEFAVYNIYRWYHGYFDHNPAHLLPRPEKEINTEIFNLIGDRDGILNRATELHSKGQSQLALQVLDVLIKQHPDHVDARKLHLNILEKLCADDYCLISRNTWIYFIDQDKVFLDSVKE
jgi:glyoxylase-like metal-dependent hydrolase (beta-lactamase superfamily II)